MVYNITPITSVKPTDCGATCLKMLCDFYNIEADLQTLIEECNTRLIGCSAKDILTVGRKYGLDMRAYKETADSLYKQDRPAIIWWKWKHFCVFCGIDEDNKVVICNPDRGKYSLSKDVFESFYSGIALTNGEAQDLPISEEATAADYEAALTELGVSI